MAILSDNARLVLEQRYLLRNTKGQLLESPNQLFRRVADAVARAELQWHDAATVACYADAFFDVMDRLLFLPNSPTLMNAGTEKQQLSACFVLPLEDSISGIFRTLQQTALIQQSGGGTGFDFTPIRPRNAPVQNSCGKASGPVSFIHVFDTATAHIKQGGRRRGANMGVLQVHHPDIENFISAKEDPSALQQFNLSVGISDAFMQAVVNNTTWQLIDPTSGNEAKTITAVKLWQNIVHHAWRSGDPGLIFTDTINRHQPTPAMGPISSTNPCGEVPLLPYESCNLGSINLAAMVKNMNIDFTILQNTIHTTIRFLDDVIEVNEYPLPEIEAMVKGNRKIGLGIMGWADTLLQMGIPYDSDKAVEKADQLMRFFAEESRKASARLASERGNFPNWEKSVYYPDQRMRNATVNSIAPTGTISIIADTSASIEPLFALAFHRRHVLDGNALPVVNKHVKQLLKDKGYWKEPIISTMLQYGSVAGIEALPASFKELLKTATEIPPLRHLQHQLAFQRYTDNAVSKTINLPATATEADVAAIFMTAWKEGAKGITVFRSVQDGKQVIVMGTENQGCKVCKINE